MTAQHSADESASAPRLARVLCFAVGVVFTAVGIWGLAQGGLDSMRNIPSTVSGETVGGFGGSPFLNFAHLTFGVLALGAGMLRRGALPFGIVALVALTAVIAYDGVALIARMPGEPLSVRWPALVLHAFGWLVALVIVMRAYRRPNRTGTSVGTVLDY